MIDYSIPLQNLRIAEMFVRAVCMTYRQVSLAQLFYKVAHELGWTPEDIDVPIGPDAVTAVALTLIGEPLHARDLMHEIEPPSPRWVQIINHAYMIVKDNRRLSSVSLQRLGQPVSLLDE